MSRKHSLANQVILVAGATGDLGSAIARRLTKCGARLILSGRDLGKLERLSNELDATSEPMDAVLATDRERLAAAVPPLNGYVYAAGMAPLAPVRYLQETALNQCFSLNAAAPLLLCRDLLKQKKIAPGAAIAWISSLAARSGTPGYSAYAGTKAALEAQARCLALELAPKQIRVNCIAPGMIPSEMAKDAASQLSPEALQAHIDQYPLGPGRPEDVAAAVAFLLSNEARWITGATLPVDGGFSA